MTHKKRDPMVPVCEGTSRGPILTVRGHLVIFRFISIAPINLVGYLFMRHDLWMTICKPRVPADFVRKYEGDFSVQLINKDICTQESDVDVKQPSPVILEFKKQIEEDVEIFGAFYEMFKQTRLNSDSDEHLIKNYAQLLIVLDRAIMKAPMFRNTSPLVSGVPMYGILAPLCNTPAGFRVFSNSKVNTMFYKIFEQWTKFLVSPASCDVLVSAEGGWFSPDALQVQANRLGMPFAQAWVCYPDQPYMGFKSWDDFFVRRFREGVRPTLAPDNPEFVNAACEATTYRIARNVHAADEFWLKEMPYSLYDILDYDPLASQFVGGTAFQGILSSLDYHRWHSPVQGGVVRTYIIPGTYYAARVDDDRDPDVISRSRAFHTAISTRAVIFIQSDNPRIGLMCFVGVGLGEISTTGIDVRKGDRVKKGDELGSFHFGGSTHLLIFRPETKLRSLPGPERLGEARKVGTLLFRVENGLDTATV